MPYCLFLSMRTKIRRECVKEIEVLEDFLVRKNLGKLGRHASEERVI